MPSPVAHVLAGTLVYQTWPYATRRHSALLWTSCAALAVLPDLDFVPGLLSGAPWRFHPSPTHTLMAAGVAGVLGACLLHRWRRLSVATVLLLVAAYASHLALDYFNVDDRAPFGMALLWPLTDARFLSPVPLFPGMRTMTAGAATTWLTSIVGTQNWGIFVREAAIFLPGLVVMQLLIDRRVARGGAEPSARPSISVHSMPHEPKDRE